MKNPFRAGSRVYLRPLEPEDAATLQPWANDPEVTRHVLISRPMTLADESAFVERMRTSERDVALAIVLRRGDRLIGATSLHPGPGYNRSAMFGILIGEKREWGRGYGTEATGLIVDHGFETMNLHRIWLHVVSYNARAIRAYEKVGFRQEGVLRQETYREGRYWDTIAMAILREEWEARREGGEPRVPASRHRVPAREAAGRTSRARNR